MLGASLVYFLFRWGSLPDEIGMHFSPDGAFDVVASKAYGFYPHIIGGLIIACGGAANFVIGRVRTGMKLTEQGEQRFKMELRFMVDIVMLLFAGYFTMWSRSVALQLPLDMDALAYWQSVLIGLLLLLMVVQEITMRRHRTEAKKSRDPALRHRICRLVMWLLTVGSGLVLLEAWQRHPANDVLYNDPDYYGLLYVANLDVYWDRKFLLIPMAAAVSILVLLELLSIKPYRVRNAELTAFLDRIKLLCGLFFFWWNLLFNSEQKIGWISPVIFTAAFIGCVVLYAAERKKQVQG